MAGRVELCSFLKKARARLSPADFGLPPAGRRVAGLRREEIAERAGISDTWYARFEAGRAQLSRKALLRVAGALRLDQRETHELLRLASTDSHGAVDQFGQGTAELRVLRRLFRDIGNAGSIGDLRMAVVGALLDIAHSPSVVFWVEEAAPNGGFHFIESAGQHEALFRGRYEEPAVMAHFHRENLLSMPVCENLAASPSPEHRAIAVRMGSEDYRTVPVQPLSSDRSIRIGWASREAGPFPAIKSLTQDLIGDYTRSWLARSSRHVDSRNPT